MLPQLSLLDHLPKLHLLVESADVDNAGSCTVASNNNQHKVSGCGP